jgi:hypothetical protein
MIEEGKKTTIQEGLKKKTELGQWGWRVESTDRLCQGGKIDKGKRENGWGGTSRRSRRRTEASHSACPRLHHFRISPSMSDYQSHPHFSIYMYSSTSLAQWL